MALRTLARRLTTRLPPDVGGHHSFVRRLPARLPHNVRGNHSFARRLTTRLPHDVGGLPSLAHASLPKDKPLLPWELEAHCCQPSSMEM